MRLALLAGTEEGLPLLGLVADVVRVREAHRAAHGEPTEAARAAAEWTTERAGLERAALDPAVAARPTAQREVLVRLAALTLAQLEHHDRQHPRPRARSAPGTISVTPIA